MFCLSVYLVTACISCFSGCFSSSHPSYSTCATVAATSFAIAWVPIMPTVARVHSARLMIDCGLFQDHAPTDGGQTTLDLFMS